ncbi:MAG: hypothetical protein HC831_12340 [Chloroflexia bacterium]|nr:hypothetical protein [Chloroflexia bacterium]
MRILLMTPTVNDDERRPDVIGSSKSKLWNRVRDRFGFTPGITPSYGLLYLSAALKKAGHETFYLDGNITSIDQVLTCISTQNIEVVGVSTLTFNWQRAKINIKTIKDIFPVVKIIIGGINATCLLEKCLEESPETDLLVYGEGEESIVELVNRLENKTELNGTLGTLYRSNGNIIKNPPYPVNKNLDNLPFPDLEVLGKNIDRYRPAPMFYKKLPHASILVQEDARLSVLLSVRSCGAQAGSA